MRCCCDRVGCSSLPNIFSLQFPMSLGIVMLGDCDCFHRYLPKPSQAFFPGAAGSSPRHCGDALCILSLSGKMLETERSWRFCGDALHCHPLQNDLLDSLQFSIAVGEAAAHGETFLICFALTHPRLWSCCGAGCE